MFHKSRLILHHGKLGCSQSIILDLRIEPWVAGDVALDELTGIGMVEMAKSMQVKCPRLLYQSQCKFSVDVLVTAGMRSGAGDGV